MGNKLKQNDALKDSLSRANEIAITVTGRKSGRTVSLPIWFVRDNDQLYLLPVKGSDTQRYKNVLKNPSIRVAANTKTHPPREISAIRNTIPADFAKN